MTRRIIANLDCEREWHSAFADWDGGYGPDQLSRPVLRHLSALGTLMRVFADEDDELWTPLPIPRGLVCDVPGLPTPRLVSGPDRAGYCSRVLPWAWVPALPTQDVAVRDAGQPMWKLAWSAPSVPPHLAAQLNHRRFAHEVRCVLPSARGDGWVTLQDVRPVLAIRGAFGSGGLVFKAPFGVAGRDRVVIHDPAAADHQRIEALLAKHGRLLCQPWRRRSADFGALAWVDDDFVLRLQDHDSYNDAQGRPRGLGTDVRWYRRLGSARANLLGMDEALVEVAVRAWVAGYRGPIGIDAYEHSIATRDGAETRLEALGEVNARMTFGLLLHCLMERLLTSRDVSGRTRVALRFAARGELPSGDHVIPLVRPVDGWTTAAWIELSAGHPEPTDTEFMGAAR